MLSSRFGLVLATIDLTHDVLSDFNTPAGPRGASAFMSYVDNRGQRVFCPVLSPEAMLKHNYVQEIPWPLLI